MNLKKQTTKDPRCQGNSINANLVKCVASFFHNKHINSPFLNYAGYVIQSTVVFTIILQWFFRFIASPIREKMKKSKSYLTLRRLQMALESHQGESRSVCTIGFSSM